MWSGGFRGRIATPWYFQACAMGRSRNRVRQNFIRCMNYLTPTSNYLTIASGGRIQNLLKKPIFSLDVAVQTEAVVSFDSTAYAIGKMETDAHDDQESTLSATDLASILKWSKDISSDINLSSGW